MGAFIAYLHFEWRVKNFWRTVRGQGDFRRFQNDQGRRLRRIPSDGMPRHGRHGYNAFDNLLYNQKIWVINQTTRAALCEDYPMPELYAYNEAFVGREARFPVGLPPVDKNRKDGRRTRLPAFAFQLGSNSHEAPGNAAILAASSFCTDLLLRVRSQPRGNTNSQRHGATRI